MLITLEEQVNPKHAAVLVIDMQRDFCCSDGLMGKNGVNVSLMQEMVPTLARFIQAARVARVPIIFIRMLSNDWVNSLPSVARLYRLGREQSGFPVCENTPGFEFYELFPEPEDCVVTKYRYSAFIGTNLDMILRNKGIITVITTGVLTNVCVESTAREAFMNGYYVVFPDDCSATTSEEEHRATLSNIRKYFGIVASSKDLIDIWGCPAAEDAMIAR
ncbi:MAG: cysteine hydrolase [Chloroflexi bacterium]|nr:cysteine hydrolase [Chloroflexota bacterium]